MNTLALLLLPMLTASPDVYFSPRGGATDAIVAEIGKAKSEVLVQAYSFTSQPIGDALLAAHKRGVAVKVICDRSQFDAPAAGQKSALIYASSSRPVRWANIRSTKPPR